MNPVTLTEDTLAEQPSLEWFRELGYEVAFGPDISPGGLRPERKSFSDVVLKPRLRSALEKLNPHLPEEAIEDALHQLLSLDSPNTFVNNHQFHQMAVNGVKVEITTAEGERRGDFARVLDFDKPANNDFLVVNQFTVIDGEHNLETDGGKIIKKMAMYHQYYGVNHAINETIRATAEEGDRKIGI